LSSPQFPSQHISLRTSARNTQSLSVLLLCVPFRRTSFARRSFSTAAPLIWNSLPPAMLNCDSLSSFNSRLKTHLFYTAFCKLLYLPVLPAPLLPTNGFMALYKFCIVIIINMSSLRMDQKTKPIFSVMCQFKAGLKAAYKFLF